MKCQFCATEAEIPICSRCMKLCTVVHANREVVRKIVEFYSKPVHLPDCAKAVNSQHQCSCSG